MGLILALYDRRSRGVPPPGLAFDRGLLLTVAAQPDPNVAFLSATPRRLCTSAQLAALPAATYCTADAARMLKPGRQGGPKKKNTKGTSKSGLADGGMGVAADAAGRGGGGGGGGGKPKGRLPSESEARAAFRAALQTGLEGAGVHENGGSAVNFDGEAASMVTSTLPGGFGIQLVGPNATPGVASSSPQGASSDSDDADAGSIGAVDTLMLPGGGEIGADGVVTSAANNNGGGAAAQPLILEILHSPGSAAGDVGTAGVRAGAAARLALGAAAPEELSPALAARFAAFESTVLTRLSALERSIDSRLAQIEAAVCPVHRCSNCGDIVSGKFCAGCGAPTGL